MIWLIAFIVMLVVVAAMAVGVMAGRKPIAGSCGGIAILGLDKESCPFCGGDKENCKRKKGEAPEEH
ncbi:MAG: (Na+)-NQR maturation NqrM [Rhodospirillaceae bacterium]